MTPVESAPLRWRPRLPTYLKQTVPTGDAFVQVSQLLQNKNLPTVCEAARCPNRTDCWARGTLTFQILGSLCTRRCHFCAETTGRPLAPDPLEPEKIAQAAMTLRLKHVVLTSPARDDLPDQGAGQFGRTIEALKRRNPALTVEVLVPDFQGRIDLLEIVFKSRPHVFNHNLETVRRLTPQVRGRATYDRSLAVLSHAAKAGLWVKSGLMVGLGETIQELVETFENLADVGVKSLTLGQYLPPSPSHFPLARYYSLEEFEELKKSANNLFDTYQVGPLVRSSYHADDVVP